MRAFFDGWTTLGQPLSMAAVLMRICVAVVIGAVLLSVMLPMAGMLTSLM